MQSTISLLPNLISDYPRFTFCLGDDFHWSSCNNTIYYIDNHIHQHAFLLHELSHALLDHQNYSRDIELVAMERQAWDHACDLASKYNLVIDDDIIQFNLDSYRDWIHARSTCPRCQATGLQTGKLVYWCLECNQKWSVNDARTCALRRYCA